MDQHNSLVRFQPDEEQLETIRQTICREATPEEFAMFVEVAKATGLNPFLNEIWFIKVELKRWNDATKQREPTGEFKVQMFAGRDGYLKIANNNPEYDGMESRVEYDKDYRPIGAFARVYRKDRKYPSEFFAPFREYYKKGYQAWEQNPSAMILKVAEAGALKRAFAISGLLTYEEIGASSIQEAKQIMAGETEEKESLAGKRASVELCEEAFNTIPADIIKQTLKKFNVTALRELDEGVLNELVVKFRQPYLDDKKKKEAIEAKPEPIKTPGPEPVFAEDTKAGKEKPSVSYELIPDHLRKQWKVIKKTEKDADVTEETYWVERDLSSCTCPSRKQPCKHIEMIRELKNNKAEYDKVLAKYPAPPPESKKEEAVKAADIDYADIDHKTLLSEIELVKEEKGVQEAVVEYFRKKLNATPYFVLEYIRKYYSLKLSSEIAPRHWQHTYSRLTSITKEEFGQVLRK